MSTGLNLPLSRKRVASRPLTRELVSTLVILGMPMKREDVNILFLATPLIGNRSKSKFALAN